MYVSQLIPLLVFLFILPSAWCSERIVTLDIRDNTGALSAGHSEHESNGYRYVNGYARTIFGPSLAYPSSHPDANSALLVRAQAGQRIAWESDTLYAPDDDGFFHLIWLAGLEKGGLDTQQAHHFKLLINDTSWFCFANRKDSSAQEWSVSGADGARLHFRTEKQDRYGDLFGMMSLTLPQKAVIPGKPLRLQVQSEDTGSADWYMTFQYGFAFTPRLREEPALLKGLSPQQLLRISIDNLSPHRSITVSAEGVSPISQVLKLGANIIRYPVATVDSATPLVISFLRGGVETGREQIDLTPVVQRDIYLLPYAHTDIGYTDVQPLVERKHWRALDDALRLIQQTRGYPEDARYKWNLEVLWPLESYLSQTDELHKDALREAIAQGTIGLNAFYANVLTGLMSAEELDRVFDYSQSLSLQYRRPITSAVISDIPGFTWGTVSAMARHGVRYFSSATNPFDRIGHMLDIWGDKPFWWKSQSGADSVLMWIPAASYASFHRGGLSSAGPDKLFDLTRSLDNRNYPYRIVQLPYTLGDNAGVDTLLPDFVKQWNETYASPRLIISTHQQMFDTFEHEYGMNLPAFSGDLTPYWEDGALSSTAEVIVNRHAANRLSQARKLLSAPLADSAFSRAWRNVILFDEHTWGAANSIDQPDDPQVLEQWRIKRQFAMDARDDADSLMKIACEFSSKIYEKEAGAFIVCNTGSQARTDLVLIAEDLSKAGDAVVDDSGSRLPSQRLSSGQLAVVVEKVPAGGKKGIHVQAGTGYARQSVRVDSLTLSNEFVTVQLDPVSGSICKLTSHVLHHEFADSSGGINRLLHMSGTDPSKVEGLRNVRIRVKERGGLIGSLIVSGEIPGCDSYECEIQLVAGIDRIDIIHHINKQAVRAKESLHIAFPFVVQGGQLRYDVADAVVRPGLDQLPGSCKNFFSVNSWVDLSTANYGITLATPDIPLAEFGQITAEQKWREDVAAGTTIYSYVMNNYWHTNFKADQSGPVDIHYALQPHGGYNVTDVQDFGQERREPLIAVPCSVTR